jgi:antagonist of KipI
MTLTGAELQFEGDAVVALTGSDFGASLPMWTSVPVKSGQILRGGSSQSGARAYLAVRGGFDVPLVMGSASVHVLTGVGGRPLRRGDILPVGDAWVRRPRPPARNTPQWKSRTELRVTSGPQASWFGSSLYAGAYTVSEESNRMGIRLKGLALANPGGHMITEGVALGAIQVPPDGQPIVLFVEHQTTGGYPKPANVISADFWRVGQIRPRDEVRFELITMEGAVSLLRQQEEWLYSL